MKYQKARNKKAEPKHIPECGECVRSEGYKIVSSQQAETSKHSSTSSFVAMSVQY